MRRDQLYICDKYRDLLWLMYYYGNGSSPLPLLRDIAVQLRISPSGAAVNRAVRTLEGAKLVKRLTWVDGRSDLVICTKTVACYFLDRASEELSSPPRYSTMVPYVASARRLDWLSCLSLVRSGCTLSELEQQLQQAGCTVYLHLSDILDYFEQNRAMFGIDSHAYQDQCDELWANSAQRYALGYGGMTGSPPSSKWKVTTLESLHKRGIYIYNIIPEKRRIYFLLFATRSVGAKRVMDHAILANQWVQSLLPAYTTHLKMFFLDAEQADAVFRDINAVAPGCTHDSYMENRLVTAHMSGTVELSRYNTNFINRRCGGVQRTDVF